MKPMRYLVLGSSKFFLFLFKKKSIVPGKITVQVNSPGITSIKEK